MSSWLRVREKVTVSVDASLAMRSCERTFRTVLLHIWKFLAVPEYRFALILLVPAALAFGIF